MDNVASIIKYPSGLAGKTLVKGDVLAENDLVYVGDFTSFHIWKRVFKTGVALNEYQSGLYFRPFQKYKVDSVSRYVETHIKIEVNTPINSRPLNLNGRFVNKNEIVQKGDLVCFPTRNNEPKKWRRVMASGHENKFENFIFRPSEPYRLDANGYYIGRLEVKMLAAPKLEEPSKYKQFIIKNDFS